MTYRLAILDFDGTLHDSFPWLARVLNEVADRHGFRRVADGELAALRGRTVPELMTMLQVPARKVPAIARDVRRMKAAALGDIPLFPGVDGMLQALAARGVTTAIVSSDAEENVRRGLGAANERLIAHFACGASLLGKARKFRQVLRASGVGADEAIAIGDEIRDIEAARRVGVHCAAVTWGYATPDALRAAGPDVMLSRIEDVAALMS